MVTFARKFEKSTIMSKIIKPLHYAALLDTKQTEQGIKLIKEFFQQNISTELRLRRVTAPLFVLKGLGINDDLNGVERAVTFPIKDLGDAKAEVVHSLAKWKRLSLAEYKIEPGYGIYTDMNAIRAPVGLGGGHHEGAANGGISERRGEAYLCCYPKNGISDLRDLSATETVSARADPFHP